MSATGIALNWTIPSSNNGNYVTYYIITYTPSCPELSSANKTVSVAPYQPSTAYSYTLRGLSSGMNYTITIRAGNVLGESSVTVTSFTLPAGNYMITYSCSYLDVILAPTGAPHSVVVFPLNSTTNRITWEEVMCSLRNGHIQIYYLIISNLSISQNYSTSGNFIDVNGLNFDTIYNISVAAANSVGNGSFSRLFELSIGSGKIMLQY